MSMRFWHSRTPRVFMPLSVQRKLESEGSDDTIMFAMRLLSRLRFSSLVTPTRLRDVSLL